MSYFGQIGIFFIGTGWQLKYASGPFMASLRDIWMCFWERRGGGTRIHPPWVGEGMIGILVMMWAQDEQAVVRVARWENR
jgi:hypothetical protein